MSLWPIIQSHVISATRFDKDKKRVTYFQDDQPDICSHHPADFDVVKAYLKTFTRGQA